MMRLARFRTTAPPTRRPATKPTFHSLVALITQIEIRLPEARCPCSKSAAEFSLGPQYPLGRQSKPLPPLASWW